MAMQDVVVKEMKLQDLKVKTPTELLSFAEETGVENASAMRKQELMFAILKQLASKETDIIGTGVVEVLQDGFGFLRSPDANYLPGPDDIYVSPSQIRRFALRSGDTVDGQIRSPKEGERYFALLKVNKINFEDPDKQRHKVHFDNLTPLYPTQWMKLETEDPTIKDFSPRVATARRCSPTSASMPRSASARSSASRSLPKGVCSAVPCTSTKAPEPVITTFMSTSAVESSE